MAMKTKKLSRVSSSIRKKIEERKEHRKAAKASVSSTCAQTKDDAPSASAAAAGALIVPGASPAVDRLSNLIPEIQDLIFEHLMNDHVNPSRVIPPWQWEPGYGDPVYFHLFGRLYMLLPWSSKIWRRVVLRQKRPAPDPDPGPSFPLLLLAATSKTMLARVEEFSRIVFLAAGPSPITRAMGQGSLQRWRVFLVLWFQQRCRFCGRRQLRRGVFCNKVAACFECEADHYGPRITERDAKLRFFLTHDHLYPPDKATTSNAITTNPKPPSRPNLTYGKSNTCTWYQEIMFFQLDEIKRLAEVVHAPSGGYKRERERRKVLARKPFETLSKQDVLDALPIQLVWTWHMNASAIAWVQLACSTYKEVKTVMDDLAFYPINMPSY